MEHYNEEIFSHPSKEEWRRIDKKYFKDGKNIIVNVDHTVEEWAKLIGKDWSDKRIQLIEKGFEKQKGKNSNKREVYTDIFDYVHYEVDQKDANKWHTDWYRKKLKQAANDVGVESEVSTHTLRKSFAFWLYMFHQFDPNCGNFIQKLFGHASLLQTLTYAGVAKYRNKQYMDEHGEFIRNVLAGKGDEIIKNMPVISIKSNDFGDVIMAVIKQMQEGKEAVDVYQTAVNMANELRIG